MICNVETDEAITIAPAEVAPWLLAWVEQNGAVVRLDPEQQLRADLNPLPDMTAAKADRLSRLILSVRDELRGLLIARDGLTVH
jgi:hypothetical protein